VHTSGGPANADAAVEDAVELVQGATGEAFEHVVSLDSRPHEVGA
jgi:hypothetical protein